MKSEYNLTPKKIIIHNPALTNSMNFINEENNGVFLFRECPNIDEFKKDYQQFKDAISMNGIEVIELMDIIKKAPIVNSFFI